jgi:group I intron endonuclease
MEGSHQKNNNCLYLKRAFNKYGLKNFKMILICICFDEDLNIFEEEYIKKYNTISPNGYNLREGGNNSNHHIDTKNKISDTLKYKYKEGLIKIVKNNKKHTEETKTKISNTLKGRKIENKLYGNTLSESNIEKLRNKSKERERSKDTNKKISDSLKKANKESKVKLTCKRKVYQYDLENNLIESYNSLTEASEKYKVSKAAISRVCNGKSKTCKGFIWSFLIK